MNVSNIITFFSTSSNKKNDLTNKIREYTLSKIQNIPPIYFQKEYTKNNHLWKILYSEWVIILMIITKGLVYTSYEILHKGGRNNNYDFMLSFYNDKVLAKQEKIEFKYGASSIDKIPQFLSLQSRYPFFIEPYDKYYYEHYLDKYIACDETITEVKPSLEIYLKYITSTNCNVLPFFEKLKSCQENNKKEKDIIVKKSIHEYLLKYGSSINIQAFIEKVKNTQREKKYLLWNKGKFYIDSLNEEGSNILFKTIKNKNTIELVSSNGNIYKLLLRWKNNKGVLNPAWQISIKRQIITKREISIKRR